ncbi:MAG TPA: hypothetical protein VIJ99_00665 [Acidimicrobiales bacterium]
MRTALARRIATVTGRCAARPVLGAMTLKNDLLGQMRYEWQHVGRTSRSREAMAALSERHPDLRLSGLIDLCDVVTLLESRGGRTVLERAEIVRALLEEAGDVELHRALLQTLIPGIVSVCRQLRFGEGIIDEPSETVGIALGLASELLTDWAGQSRQYAAPDILSALRGRLRRWLLKEKAARRVVSHYDQHDEPATESSPLLARLHSFRGSQYDRLARLTYARVYEGRSLREIAADDNSAPASLQKELQHFAVRFLI